MNISFIRHLHKFLIVFIFASAAIWLQAADPVAQIKIRNSNDQAISNIPVTFGHIFKSGDIKGQLGVRGDGIFQVDEKRRHPDGSLRFAVISALLPKLDANATVALQFADRAASAPKTPSDINTAGLSATDFDVAVTLTIPPPADKPDGVPTKYTASVRKLFSTTGIKIRTLLSGPAVTEWLVDGTINNDAGEADPDLRVQFQVRTWPGYKGARVSVVVENCLDTWAGNIGYDVAITVGKKGELVYEKKDVNHRPLSRWRKIITWGEVPANVDIIHDYAYLSSTGALPYYHPLCKVSESQLAQMDADWRNSSETDIMGSGSLNKYMPTTGGRPEIAPYPIWAVRYLLSMDPRAKQVVLGNGDLAGSWPIHVRNSKTGRIMTLDERPEFWLDSRGIDRPVWQADRKAPPSKNEPAGKAYTLTPDTAHLGSFAYIPYLVTGDYYYLEEAYFWANYVLISMWPHCRQNGQGLLCGQVRGNAWGLRNIADAAYIVTAYDPEGPYFDNRIANNLAHWTATLLGPPEYSKLGFASPRTMSDARIHNPANPNWVVMVWWEHDYLIWSLHHLVELGYAAAAKPRDYFLRWRVGSFVNPKEFDPKLSGAYRTVVGEIDADKKIHFYDSWHKLEEENLKHGIKPELSQNAGSYSYSARMGVACGVDAGFLQAKEALKWLDDNLSNIGDEVSRNPGFAINPRNID